MISVKVLKLDILKVAMPMISVKVSKLDILKVASL